MLLLFRKTRTITDDRGASHVISWTLNPTDDSREYLTRRVGAEFRETMRFKLNRRTIGRIAVMWLSGIVLVVGVNVISSYKPFLGVPHHYLFVMAWPLIVLGMMVFKNNSQRTMYQRAAIISAEEGACGSCWYNLCDLPPTSDGMLVCPECQAAWLASRLRPGVREGRSASDPLPKREIATTTEARTLARILTFDAPVPVKDDEGRVFSLVRSRDLRLRAKESQGATRDRFVEASRKLRYAGFFRRLLFSLAIAFFGCQFFLMAYLSTPFASQSITDWGLWLVMVVFALFMLSTAFTRFVRSDSASPARAKVLLLARSLCPSCGSSLSDIKANAEGCSTCPQCSAVWKVTGTYDIRSLFRPPETSV